VKSFRLLSYLLALQAIINASFVYAENQTDSLNRIYTNSKKYDASHTYYQPSKDELLLFQHLFTDIIIAHEKKNFSKLNDLNSVAGSLGFTINRQIINFSGVSRGVTIVQEKQEIRQGGGIYFLLDQKTSSGDTTFHHAILECPHARSDVYTGRLGQELFERGDISAFYSSTMRRNVLSDKLNTNQEDTENSDPHGNADPAHNRFSYFQSAHLSWMRSHPDSLVIQFHGFKHTPDELNRQFDLILSCGLNKEQQSGYFLESERQLRLCLPNYKLGVFGRDTNLFGALTNVQGQYINNYTSGTFWHLEMERNLRNKLMKQQKLRTRFLNCITRLINTYEKL